MIALDRRERLSFTEAGRLLGVTHEAIWRWATTGQKTHDGRLIRLESIRVGRTYFTDEAAIRRFVNDTSPFVIRDDGEASDAPDETGVALAS